MQPNEFICADYHFYHKKISEFSGRPWTTDVLEMNEQLIQRWNRKVPKGANVYFLGDFSFHPNVKVNCELIDRLHGRIHFIRGNHDKGLLRKKEITSKFVWVKDRHESKTIDNKTIVMDHYPHLVWNKGHHGSWMLHGHSHGSIPDEMPMMRHGKVVFDDKGEVIYMKTTRLDIGVDMHPEYEPFSYAEIAERMEGREYNTIDHH